MDNKYKDSLNKVHQIPEGYEHLMQGWPVGYVKITDEEAEALQPVPPVIAPVYTCTPWQIRKALNAQGLRDGVEAAIAASTDRTLKDGWEFATEFHSDDSFVIGIGASLGKNETETAQLIQYAATL